MTSNKYFFLTSTAFCIQCSYVFRFIDHDSLLNPGKFCFFVLFLFCLLKSRYFLVYFIRLRWFLSSLVTTCTYRFNEFTFVCYVVFTEANGLWTMHILTCSSHETVFFATTCSTNFCYIIFYWIKYQLIINYTVHYSFVKVACKYNKSDAQM